MLRKWETLEHTVLYGMSLSNPSPPGAGNYVEEDVERGEEQEVVDDSQRAESSRHTRANAV